MLKHRNIRRRLILYLDHELPEREMKEVREHLSGCSSCSRQKELLESLWNLDGSSSKEPVPPFMWGRIKNSIVSDAAIHFPIWQWSTGIVPLTVRVVFALAAILLGIYLATPPNIGRSSKITLTQSKELAQEFRLDLFDMVPSGTPGSALVERLDAEH